MLRSAGLPETVQGIHIQEDAISFFNRVRHISRLNHSGPIMDDKELQGAVPMERSAVVIKCMQLINIVLQRKLNAPMGDALLQICVQGHLISLHRISSLIHSNS